MQVGAEHAHARPSRLLGNLASVAGAFMMRRDEEWVIDATCKVHITNVCQ